MVCCTAAERMAFLRDAPLLEQALVNSGMKLFKYRFSETREGLSCGFGKGAESPLRPRELLPDGLAPLSAVAISANALEEITLRTETADAPWVIVKADDRKRARLNCLQHLLSSLEYPNRNRKVVVGPDPLIVGSGRHAAGEATPNVSPASKIA